jgi:tetratricopeptide (TPR) repeat protein
MSDSRLAEKLKDGAYYDYEQMVKTIFFKYKMRKREKEMRELIERAMNDLSNAEQKDLVVDILEIYFVEHVKKVKDMEAVDDFLVKICHFAMEKGDQKRAQGVFERIIAHSNNKRQEIAERLALSYKEEGIYSKAYKNYYKSRNETEICLCMEKIIEYGYESERDLFLTRACLDMLVKSKEIEKAVTIREHFRSTVEQTPLLNFLDFFLECLKLGELGLIK